MVTTVGRDPAWTAEAMAKLWGHVEQSGFAPLHWEIGLFNLRDLVEGRDEGFRGREWRVVRLETIWGCPISVATLFDHIALVAASKSSAKDAELRRFVVGEVK